MEPHHWHICTYRKLAPRVLAALLVRAFKRCAASCRRKERDGHSPRAYQVAERQRPPFSRRRCIPFVWQDSQRDPSHTSAEAQRPSTWYVRRNFGQTNGCVKLRSRMSQPNSMRARVSRVHGLSPTPTSAAACSVWCLVVQLCLGGARCCTAQWGSAPGQMELWRSVGVRLCQPLWAHCAVHRAAQRSPSQAFVYVLVHLLSVTRREVVR